MVEAASLTLVRPLPAGLLPSLTRTSILVSLSDAGQLGLLNLLVQKKLPRILAGG